MFKLFAFLLVIVSQISQANEVILKNHPDMDSECLSKFTRIYTQWYKREFKDPETTEQKQYFEMAKRRAQIMFGAHMQSQARYTNAFFMETNYRGLAATVFVCDSEEGASQGNCVQFFFNSSSNLMPKLILAKEQWHIGPGKAFLVCEEN